MKKEGLCVLPEGTKSEEFFKVLGWICSRTDDLHGGHAMALRRAKAARDYGVLNDAEYARALEMINVDEAA